MQPKPGKPGRAAMNLSGAGPGRSDRRITRNVSVSQWKPAGAEACSQAQTGPERTMRGAQCVRKPPALSEAEEARPQTHTARPQTTRRTRG